MEKWNDVAHKWKSDGIFVAGCVFPNEGYFISGNDKAVKKGFVNINNLKIVSFITHKANDLHAAIALAKESPVLEQGGTVEVPETLQRPATN